jgi:hypothetical protein
MIACGSGPSSIDVQKGWFMVNFCANTDCGKPLHYLREGRIFLFEVATGIRDSEGKPARHLEHFWFCGLCSESLSLTQGTAGIQVIRKLPPIWERREADPEDAEEIAAGLPF